MNQIINVSGAIGALIVIYLIVCIIAVPYIAYQIVAALVGKKGRRRLHWRRAGIGALTLVAYTIILILLGYLFYASFESWMVGFRS
jgi:uncharacterized membrane protein